MVPTDCSAYYPATDQRSVKVQQDLKGLRTAFAPSQLTTESRPQFFIGLVSGNHVDAGLHRPHEGVGGVGQLRVV